MDGLSVRSFPDGKIDMEKNYVNGEEDGPVTWYHQNGNIKTRGYYQTGKKSWYLETMLGYYTRKINIKM